MQNQFCQMIHYYLNDLSNSGYSDPVRELVRVFVDYLSEFLSDEQIDFIDKELNTKEKQKKDAITILKAIDKESNVNKDYIDVLTKLIKSM